MNARDIVVDTGWVAERLDDPSVLLVDVRPPQFYAQAHLPGAVNLPIFFLSGPGGGPPPADAFAERLGALGITRDTHVIAYDEGGSPAASRLFWVLSCYGHPTASVMDGGITKWRHEGRDWEYMQVPRSPERYEIAGADPSVMVGGDDLVARLGAPDLKIVDSRAPGEYLGTQPTAARDGHIPGAINIDWSNNLEQVEVGVFEWRGDEDLRRLYADAGVRPDQQVVAYCQSGNRASATFVALRKLGYDRVAVYVPGWQEWGNRGDTPVEP